MYYILNPNIALRSWWLVPYAYYTKGIRNAIGLKKEELELLSICDGMHDIEMTPLLNRFVLTGMVKEISVGEAELSPWQNRECDNRYFPAMNWMITGKCNYNCLHCFNAADEAPLMSEFSLDEAESLLADAEKCGINAITVTGGEPMLHRHFFEILESIYRHGMFVEELNTNGFYINQTSLDRMKAISCNPLIKISFDGIGHHDWLRNKKGAEEDALRAIRVCVANGFRVKVQTNIHRRNIDCILPTLSLLDRMGVEETRIIRTTEVPRWNRNAAGSTLELREYFDEMLNVVSKYIREERGMNLDVWQFMTVLPKVRKYRIRPVECGIGEYRDSLPVCRGNRGMIAVAANGNVFPCMQMSGYYEAKNDILGNVKLGGLQPLLQAGRYLSEVCTTVEMLAEKNSVCGNCTYFKHCVGGCRAIALTLTGDKLGVDYSKCLFYKEGYYERLVEMMGDWENLSKIEVGTIFRPF